MGIYLTLKGDWEFNGEKKDWVDIAVKELAIGPYTINYNGVALPITVLSEDRILLHRTQGSGKTEKVILFGDYADEIFLADLDESEPDNIEIGPSKLFIKYGHSELLMIEEEDNEFCMILVWGKEVPEVSLPVFPQIP